LAQALLTVSCGWVLSANQSAHAGGLKVKRTSLRWVREARVSKDQADLLPFALIDY
jgi:hypothetical protein